MSAAARVPRVRQRTAFADVLISGGRNGPGVHVMLRSIWKVWRRVRGVGEAALLLLAFLLIPLLPRVCVVGLARFCGWSAYHLGRGLRRVALANLDVVYGDRLDAAAKQAIARESFCTFALMTLDVFWFSIQTARRIDRVVSRDESFVNAAGVERPILFRSAAIRRLLEMTDRVAPSETTVLITGESGTGKELVARRIHVRSGRAEGPFVAVNCAAVPPELLESELFGHERGAFTGAVRARQGRFRQAEGGTLFLDEIAELPLPLQSKLLRVLQERVVDPVGADKPAPVDMRIVAATNRDLRGLAAHGHFREDLYYRLNVVELVVPPLRERAQDIEPLVRHFAAQFARGRDVVVSPALLDEMRRRPWPGNVRELENAVERLVIFCEGDGLSVRDLPPLPEDAGRPAEEGEPGSGDFLQELPRLPAGGLSLLDLEKFVIERVLEVTAGNVSAAARYLRVARHFLTYRMDKFGIERPSINGRVFASSGPIGAASPARERGDHT